MAFQAPAERVSPERSEGQREGRSPATACWTPRHAIRAANRIAVYGFMPKSADYFKIGLKSSSLSKMCHT